MGQAQSAQVSALGAAKSDFGPRVSTYGNWEEDRTSFAGSGGNNWVAGVQISVDILPLGKRAQLARESAAKQKIDAQVAASEQHFRLEVSQAHIHRQTAALQLETAQAAMDQSAESLRIVKNRYGAGLPPLPICCGPRMPSGRANPITGMPSTEMPWPIANFLYATGTLTPDAAEELQ